LRQNYKVFSTIRVRDKIGKVGELEKRGNMGNMGKFIIAWAENDNSNY